MGRTTRQTRVEYNKYTSFSMDFEVCCQSKPCNVGLVQQYLSKNMTFLA
jgi:hypothetical protein